MHLVSRSVQLYGYIRNFVYKGLAAPQNALEAVHNLLKSETRASRVAVFQQTTTSENAEARAARRGPTSHPRDKKGHRALSHTHSDCLLVLAQEFEALVVLSKGKRALSFLT